MKLDLHVHTDISDGFMTIEQTLLAAKARGLDGVAITDHDTTAGLLTAVNIGAVLGLRVIPAIEISAMDKVSGVKVHILGYFNQLPAQHVQQLCKPLLAARHQRSLEQIRVLQEHGYNIECESILRARQGRPIYKQHIMQELILSGYTDKIYSDLYKKLFKNGGICAGDIDYIEATAAIQAIKADGGIAVLAHPGHDNNYFLLEQLLAAGLDGIEIFHEQHTLSDVKRILRLAKQHNLLLTGGSDYHGETDNRFFGRLTCPQRTAAYFVDNHYCLESFLHDLAIQAGNYIREHTEQQTTCVDYKENSWDNLVTELDIALERFLVQSIYQYMPDSGFITEEKTTRNSKNNEYTWIIDPLDGTTNFVTAKAEYAVSVALYKNGQPYAGMVYDVAKQDVYVAVAGCGAWLNGSKLERISAHKPLKECLLDFSIKTVVELRERGKNLLQLAGLIRGHRATGCASLAICKIAMGVLDGYISSKLCIWDYAAAAIFLRELGGEILTCKEHEDSEQCTVFVAAQSPALLQELLVATAVR